MPQTRPVVRVVAGTDFDSEMDALLNDVSLDAGVVEETDAGNNDEDDALESPPPATFAGAPEDFSDLLGGQAQPAPVAVADTQKAPVAAAGPDNLTRAVEMLARAEEVRQMQAAQVEEERRREAERTASEARRLRDPFSAEELALSADEEAVYAQSRAVIDKLARQAMQRYHADVVAPMHAAVEEMRSRVGAVEQVGASTNQRAAFATLATLVPDLNDRVNDNNWNGYLQSPLPMYGSTMSVGQLLQQHVNSGDLNAAAAVIKNFQRQPAAAPPAAVSAPAPARINGGGAPASVAARDVKPERLVYSRFEQAAHMAETGRLSQEKFNKITERFLDAADKGLVDYDK